MVIIKGKLNKYMRIADHKVTQVTNRIFLSALLWAINIIPDYMYICFSSHVFKSYEKLYFPINFGVFLQVIFIDDLPVYCLIRLPAFPRKALEAELNLHHGGQIGKVGSF